MTKVLRNTPITPISTQKLGNYSIYKRKGSEGPVIRSKGGATKEKIRAAPEFAGLRMHQQEFAGCSRMASKILRAIDGIKYLADYNLLSGLLSIANTIQNFDTLNPKGKRSIYLSQYSNILKGFNINQQHPFDLVMKHAPEATFSRTQLKATLYFPELYPNINFANPWQKSFFRVIATLGIVPDMISSELGYAQADESETYNPVEYISDWLPTEIVIRERVEEIQLGSDTIMNPFSTMVVGIGVEYGTMVKGVETAVKYSGSGKILAVG